MNTLKRGIQHTNFLSLISPNLRCNMNEGFLAFLCSILYMIPQSAHLHAIKKTTQTVNCRNVVTAPNKPANYSSLLGLHLKHEQKKMSGSLVYPRTARIRIAHLFHFLNCIISLSRDTKLFWFNVDDHQNWIWTVTAQHANLQFQIINLPLLELSKCKPSTFKISTCIYHVLVSKTQSDQIYCGSEGNVLTLEIVHGCRDHSLGV